MFRVLFLGDVVGRPGRQVLKQEVPALREQWKPDVVIANGENSAGGLGIDPGTAQEIYNAGVDLITTGNHIWNKREINPYLETNAHRIVRPMNFAPGAPGVGALKWKSPSGVTLGLANIQGRVFMSDLLDCPFRAIDATLQNDFADCQIIFVDFHAEATSEKVAMAYHLDGRATVLVGTHTHVQTADERVLKNGLAYISDAGMCGPREGVIGVSHEVVVQKFLTGRPHKFDVASEGLILNGVVVDCDPSSRKASKIQRLFIVKE